MWEVDIFGLELRDFEAMFFLLCFICMLCIFGFIFVFLFLTIVYNHVSGFSGATKDAGVYSCGVFVLPTAFFLVTEA